MMDWVTNIFIIIFSLIMIIWILSLLAPPLLWLIGLPIRFIFLTVNWTKRRIHYWGYTEEQIQAIDNLETYHEAYLSFMIINALSGEELNAHSVFYAKQILNLGKDEAKETKL